MEEQDITTKIDSITPTPEQLRALTHPIRLRLLGLLRLEGSQTATDLSRTTGLSTGSTSYHLRMLAKYGFIEQDQKLSIGKKLFWRSVNTATVTNTPQQDDPDAESKLDAMYGFQQMVAAEYSRQILSASEQWQTLPLEWQNASTLSDFPIRVTANEAQEIMHRVAAILLKEMHDHPLHSNDSDEASESDTDTQAFSIQLLGFPVKIAMQSDNSLDEHSDEGKQ
jgi:DNA-binding transcriptional ArsR family regulator